MGRGDSSKNEFRLAGPHNPKRRVIQTGKKVSLGGREEFRKKGGVGRSQEGSINRAADEPKKNTWGEISWGSSRKRDPVLGGLGEKRHGGATTSKAPRRWAKRPWGGESKPGNAPTGAKNPKTIKTQPH